MTSIEFDDPAPVLEDVIVDSIRVTSRNGEALRGLLVSPCTDRLTSDGRLHIRTDVYKTQVRWTDDDRPAVLHAKGVAMERRRSRKDDRDFLEALNAVGITCKEIHLARDSSGPFSHDYLAMAWHQDRVVSRNKIHSHSGKARSHTTLYVGTPTSDIEIRAYDRSERLRQKTGKEPDQLVSRFEIVGRRQTAHALFKKLIEIPEVTDSDTGDVTWPVLPLFNAVLAKEFYVMQSPDDPNRGDRARVKVDSLYQEFINVRDTNLILTSLRERSDAEDFENKVEWILSVAGGVHMIRELLGVQGMERYMALGAAKPYHHPLLESDRDLAVPILMKHLGLKPTEPKGGPDV